jgi:hypothetical protein
MAQTRVTADLLREFAQILRTENERFETIKLQMDEQLFGFLWNDPVALKFKANYEDRLQSLKTKLFPAMEKYQQYLDEEAKFVDIYTENGSPSLSAFKAAAMAAGVVGVGASAGVAAIGNVSRIDTQFLGNEKSSFTAMSVGNTYRPAPDPKHKETIKTILTFDYKNRNDMFSKDGFFTKKYLEDIFNERYGLKNKEGKNTVTIEWTDKGMMNNTIGYYDEATNKVYLNKNIKWTNEQLINTVAHEYYHAYDSKIENQREVADIIRLKRAKKVLEANEKDLKDLGPFGSNAVHNAYIKKEGLKENAKKLKENAKELEKAYTARQTNNNYYRIPASCYSKEKQFMPNEEVKGQTCSNHYEKYVTSEEEHEARIRGESAEAAYKEVFKRT